MNLYSKTNTDRLYDKTLVIKSENNNLYSKDYITSTTGTVLRGLEKDSNLYTKP